MSNRKHIEIIKQGVDVWNAWRAEHPNVVPKLDMIDLEGARLNKVNFSRTTLYKANLAKAGLERANLYGADLQEANLSNANLSEANLSKATLINSNLNEAGFNGTIFFRSDLRGASIRNARIYHTLFIGSMLDNVNLAHSEILDSKFIDIDFHNVQGLEELSFLGPSSISIDSLFSFGKYLPQKFLREIGLPEALITYLPSLMSEPIQFYSCFISYSSKDTEFAERIYADLQNKGVRCWFAPKDLKIGEKIRFSIDESIRVYEKLLVILSKNSISSDWVEKEVETAMDRERQHKRTILFPIRLDDSVMTVESGWAADIRRLRNIGDFRHWKRHEQYQKAFNKLLNDLKQSENAGRA